MAVYYISTCHDCEEKVMWLKCPVVTANKWHTKFEEELHNGHDVELGSDMDDEFYYSMSGYKDLGIWDDEKLEKYITYSIGVVE